MQGLRTVLITFAACMMLAWPGQAADIDYAVTVKGFCRFQTFFGWTPCQENVHFVDKDGNVYDFSGGKNKQIDNTNLYPVIDQRVKCTNYNPIRGQLYFYRP